MGEMKLADRLARDWRFLRGLRRTLARVASIKAESDDLLCDDLEDAVDRHRERPAISFEGRALNYGELDALANRYAHWAKEQGIRRGDTVALFMPNRLEYLPIWYGLSKVGVVTALINNQLVGEALAHCLNLSAAIHCIVDEETAEPFEQVREDLTRTVSEWTLAETHQGQRNLVQALRSCSSLRPDRAVREGIVARSTALLIYTSGTTGLPKAARITHMRAQLYMRGFAGATDAHPDDRIYITLPLYHATGGLCATGAALMNGASIALRRRFSASRFWPDIAEEKATMFAYIGELGRYLVNQPPEEDIPTHSLRLAFGNGLRPDVWAQLEDRFHIPQVLEFYGSTEGNVSMFNFDGHRGACGRIPDYLKGMFNVRLVRFDVESETPVRGTDGFCIACGPDEVGECLGEIRDEARTAYTGYADKAASEKKVLSDVFAKGDRWFTTGDLLKRDRDGYFYFVDRIGDTFRWKGENVSTNEVAAALADVPGVREINVYGVGVGDMPGKAGMAALVVGKDFDIEAFAEAAARDLPPYAQPVFVRVLPAFDTTGTFKVRKMDLVATGFDPARVKGPLYVKSESGAFEKITPALHARIVAGEVRL
jgi:fatty-acyl-CoA synthase